VTVAPYISVVTVAPYISIATVVPYISLLQYYVEHFPTKHLPLSISLLCYDPLYCPESHVDLFFTHVGVVHWLILYIRPSIRTAYGVDVEFTLNPSSQGFVVIINNNCEGILPYEVVRCSSSESFDRETICLVHL
jgi:hypothetical protein